MGGRIRAAETRCGSGIDTLAKSGEEMGPPHDEGPDVPELPDDSDWVINGLPMAQILPDSVVRRLRKHFYAGVKRVEVRFKYHAADEDSVTGALANDLIEPLVEIDVGEQVYLWSTASFKIRGRGTNAPEMRLGGDGIFQFEVFDARMGRMLVRKGLLFQSKKRSCTGIPSTNG
jgi:hypothetical protein